MADLIIFVILMGLGYGFGKMAETRHYTSIREREDRYRELVLIASKYPPADMPVCDTRLVNGSVVISVDYFKRFLAGLRGFLGGRVKSYESLLDRARREAILRMKESAQNIGATRIFNMKFETASISKGGGKTIGSVEVLAYGTAFIPPKKVLEKVAASPLIVQKKMLTPKPQEKVYGKITLRLIPEKSKDTVCEYLAKLSKTSKGRIVALISKTPAVLAKNIEKKQALKIIPELNKMGVMVEFTPHPPGHPHGPGKV